MEFSFQMPPILKMGVKKLHCKVKVGNILTHKIYL